MEKSREVEKDHLKYVEDIRFQFKNYKSFPEETEIKLKPVTLIFGKNGSGKSAILEAIDLFFKSAGVQYDIEKNYLDVPNFKDILSTNNSNSLLKSLKNKMSSKNEFEPIKFSISAKTKGLPLIDDEFYESNGYENKIQFDIQYIYDEKTKKGNYFNNFTVTLPFGKVHKTLTPSLDTHLMPSLVSIGFLDHTGEPRGYQKEMHKILTGESLLTKIDPDIRPLVLDFLLSILINFYGEGLAWKDPNEMEPVRKDELIQLLKKQFLKDPKTTPNNITEWIKYTLFIFNKHFNKELNDYKIESVFVVQYPFFIEPYYHFKAINDIATNDFEENDYLEELSRRLPDSCLSFFNWFFKVLKKHSCYDVHSHLSYLYILHNLWQSGSSMSDSTRNLFMLDEEKTTKFSEGLEKEEGLKLSFINNFLERIDEKQIEVKTILESRNFSKELLISNGIRAIHKGNSYKSALPLISNLFDAFEQNAHFILIQEPEQNLHPSLQSRLTEEIIREVREKNKFVIFETHSENVLYRVMRLAKEKKYGLNSEDVQIYYVEQDEKGVSHVIDLGLDQKNRFTRSWPKDFFYDKDEDVFLY